MFLINQEDHLIFYLLILLWYRKEIEKVNKGSAQVSEHGWRMKLLKGVFGGLGTREYQKYLDDQKLNTVLDAEVSPKSEFTLNWNVDLIWDRNEYDGLEYAQVIEGNMEDAKREAKEATEDF